MSARKRYQRRIAGRVFVEDAKTILPSPLIPSPPTVAPGEMSVRMTFSNDPLNYMSCFITLLERNEVHVVILLLEEALVPV